MFTTAGQLANARNEAGADRQRRRLKSGRGALARSTVSRSVSVMDIPVPSFVVDDATGWILSANQRAEQLFGFAGFDVSRTRLTDLLGVDVELVAPGSGVAPGHIDLPLRGIFEVVVARGLQDSRSDPPHSLVMLTPSMGGPFARLVGSPIVVWDYVAEECRALDGELLCVAVGVVGLEAVNSDFCRSTGDFAIAEIHQRLKLAGGQGCLAERVDGGRFLILVASGGDDLVFAQRLISAANRPIATPQGDVVLGCAAGVTIGPSSAPLVLFDRAVRRLEHALECGAGTIEWIDSARRQRTASARLAAPMLAAAAAGEIVAAIQPVVSLFSGTVVELETSARWPAHEHLSPLNLVEMARDIGLLGDLRVSVLRSALDLWRYHVRGDAFWRISITVGARELTSPTFVDTMLSQLEDADVAPSLLQIEISDEVPVDELRSVKLTIDALRASGVRFSLAGLRHGAVNWSSLNALEVDAIKIEADVLEDDARSGHHESALRSLLALAAELGVDVVATGVDTSEQREQLLSLGCVFGQGCLCGGHSSDVSAQSDDDRFDQGLVESRSRFRSRSSLDQPISTTPDDTRNPPPQLTGDAHPKQVLA